MSSVNIVVEGQTEQTFVREVLAPYLAPCGVYARPVLIGRPGHKGGAVQFDRANRDILSLLKQRPDSYVTTMFDLFGIDRSWPGYDKITATMKSGEKARVLEAETKRSILSLLPELYPVTRFIPYIGVHEFEALLYSDIETLSRMTGIALPLLQKILNECGEPEEINSSPEGAPSKRLLKLAPSYRKIAMGVSISQATGIDVMRSRCPHFNAWLGALETTKSS